jgi:hypothetical protein
MKRTITCPLTLQERTKRQLDLVSCDLLVAELELERKTALTAFAIRQRQLTAKRRDFMAQLVAGAEEREVDVEERLNEQTGTMQTIRLDTGAVIDERPLDASERQTSLFNDVAEPELAKAR